MPICFYKVIITNQNQLIEKEFCSSGKYQFVFTIDYHKSKSTYQNIVMKLLNIPVGFYN